MNTFGALLYCKWYNEWICCTDSEDYKGTIEEDDVWIDMNWIERMLKWWWWWCILWVHEGMHYLKSYLLFIEVTDRTVIPWRKIFLNVIDALKASGIHTLCDSFQGLVSTIPLSSLDSITLDSFRKIFRDKRLRNSLQRFYCWSTLGETCKVKTSPKDLWW